VCPSVNLTIAGEISSEFDLQSFDKLEVDGVIIGKALYKKQAKPKYNIKNIKVN